MNPKSWQTWYWPSCLTPQRKSQGTRKEWDHTVVGMVHVLKAHMIGTCALQLAALYEEVV